MGSVSSIQICLDVWNCFNYARPLTYCLIFLCSVLYIVCTVNVPQHEVLTRTEWILASTGDIGSVSACNRRQQYQAILDQLNAAPSKHEALNQCWFDAGPASQTVGQHWVNVVFAGSVDKCFAPKRKKNPLNT